ncbi:hypothetical protein DFH06DRAFT_1351357 [Mycena polygramma]|nr:hypothetical protein DFH06DRAFT_1351357 [Mycena polygramma]
MVPLELIEIILSDLDHDSLRACALASSRFRLPAQRLLFKEMSFPVEHKFDPEAAGVMQRASDILSSTPHLLAFVREFTVGRMYRKEGIEALHALLRTFRHAKLERFSIDEVDEYMPDDICAALVEIFVQSSPKKVVLWGFDDMPPSILVAAFASCQDVVVRCHSLHIATTVDSAPQPANVSLSPDIHARGGDTSLESLDIRNTLDAAEFLLQPAISRLLSGLRKLEIYALALSAINSCSATLTHLKLRRADDMQAYVLESGVFPRLCALEILTLEDTHTGTWSTMMEESVAPSLSKSLPRLKVLNVGIQTHYRSDAEEGTRMPRAPALDAALTGSTSLREVNLTIDCYQAGWDETELLHYRKSVEEGLPAVHDNGLLIISRVPVDLDRSSDYLDTLENYVKSCQ